MRIPEDIKGYNAKIAEEVYLRTKDMEFPQSKDDKEYYYVAGVKYE